MINQTMKAIKELLERLEIAKGKQKDMPLRSSDLYSFQVGSILSKKILPVKDVTRSQKRRKLNSVFIKTFEIRE